MRFYKIKGEKVGLAVITREDLPKFVEWLNDPEVSIYLDPTRIFHMEDEEEGYESMRKSDRDIVLAIVTLPEEELIGSIGLHITSRWSGSAELGIFIGRKEYWGKGYGREAIKLMLDFGFNVLGLEHVWLRVKDFNKRAIRCYKAVGFREVGRLRKAARQPDGRHDVLIMDILREEFNGKHKSRFREIQERA